MSKGIVIVGGGSRGLYFTDMLTNRLKRKVAGVVENHIPSHEIAKIRFEEFGTPDTKLFESLDDLAKNIPLSDADTLFVMTPEWTHRSIFEQAVNLGYHIFLEKPIATKKEDVMDILRLSKKTDKTIQVGFVLRSSVFYRQIKEIADSGKIGKIVQIQMRERLGLQHGSHFYRTWHRKTEYTGGFLNEKCSHDLDIMCWIKESQAEPKEVFSYASRHFCPPKDTPEKCDDCSLDKCPWRFKGTSSLKNYNGKHFYDSTNSGLGRCIFHSDMDIYDHQSLILTFHDGTQGAFQLTMMSAEPGRDISIYGTDGCIIGDMENGKLRYQNYWEGEWQEVDLGQLGGHGGGDEGIVSGFLDAVAKGTKPIASVKAGARASLIAFASDESVRTKRTIQIESTDV